MRPMTLVRAQPKHLYYFLPASTLFDYALSSTSQIFQYQSPLLVLVRMLIALATTQLKLLRRLANLNLLA